MPDQDCHVELANRTQLAMLQLLNAQQDVIAEWVATMAFYKALHVIEALFFSDPEIRHGGDHGQRREHLKRNRRYRGIQANYQHLWEASTVARYLSHPNGKVFKSFTSYMSLAMVCEELIGKRLHAIEKEALSNLKEASLMTVDQCRAQLGL